MFSYKQTIMKEITLGHTPDSDDAFMFFALDSGELDMRGFSIQHVIEDIETLNMRALNNELDVTAVSAHAYGYLQDYVILRSGGSFGINYGPVVLSKRKLSMGELRNSRIAIPGKMTTANLLLRLTIGNFEAVEMKFDLIPKAIKSLSVDAGVVIHEMQLSYGDDVELVIDLGKWWNLQTNGLPVPLGINVASRKGLSPLEINKFNALFRESIEYGLNHVEDALDYSMRYGRGQSRDIIARFVKMYVNYLTVDMGENGKNSIIRLLEKAKSHGILEYDKVVFSEG
ncbi:MAG: MqnA/MqnD/SBP family protein [Nitrososphaeraceae archaeon]